MEENNPKLDIEALKLIKAKIEKNIEQPVDYKTLDYFVSSVYQKDFILNKLKENGFDSYELFIIEKKNPSPDKSKLVNGTLLGFILGAISFLEEYLLKK
jgi:hypothetical protein